jgi:hypothetical protein
MQAVDVGVGRIVLGTHQVPLPAPAPDLAFEIAGGFAEVAKAHRLGVDRVQIGENLDQCIDAIVDGVLVTERLELVGVAHDAAVDVLDHLERGTKHRIVVTHGDGTGHRHRRVV